MGMIGMVWAVNGDHNLISSQIPNRPWRIHFQDAQGWSLLHHAASNNKVIKTPLITKKVKIFS